MRPSDQELETIALEAARSAADRIREAPERTAVETKSSPTDVVTATDLASERLVREHLATATPGAHVLGEEEGSGMVGDGPCGDVEWIIDPLDGTVNFTYGIPVVAVSIAAAVDGRVVAGAVIDVFRRQEFSSHSGGGSRVDGVALASSTCRELTRALVATGFSYDVTKRGAHGAMVARLVGRVRDVRAFGSAALHCCWVGAGWLDGYVERDIKRWDYAAGALIAQEAGATFEAPCDDNHDLVTIAAPGVFDDLRALMD